MLEIVNERGEVLEFSEKTTIPIERNNMLFNSTEEIVIDVSYTGRASLSPSNKNFIGYGNMVYAKNDKYELPIKVYYSSNLFFEGIFSYKITDEIEFVLKTNFFAIVELLKNTNLTDLFFDDVDLTLLYKNAFESKMYQMASNPQDYPFTFFPIKNPSIHTWSDSNKNNTGWINQFIINQNKFDVIPSPPYSNDKPRNCVVPFFRLNWLIKKIGDVIGYKVSGSFLNDEKMKQRFIYSRVGRMIGGQYVTDPSFVLCNQPSWYLPNVTISEFLKVLRNRYGLCFDFNNNSLNVYTSDDVLNPEKIIDLSEYIEKTKEIEVIPEKEGITAYLEPDSEDQYFYGPNQELIPTNKLVVGNGAKEYLINASTLKETAEANGITYTRTDQECFLEIGYPGRAPKLDFQKSIRFIRFQGIKNHPGTGNYPSNFADELNESDFQRFKFIGTSKKITITANIPTYTLLGIKPTDTVMYKSESGETVVLLIEKISFDLQNTSVTKADISGRLFNNENVRVGMQNTQVMDNLLSFCANFPDSISPLVYDIYTDEAIPQFIYRGRITQPCNKYGIGGQKSSPTLLETSKPLLLYIGKQTTINPRFVINEKGERATTATNPYYNIFKISRTNNFICY